jgi:hypothetical protein
MLTVAHLLRAAQPRPSYPMAGMATLPGGTGHAKQE